MINNIDEQQKIHHSKHYQNILLGGLEQYDGFINPKSIWYWMHTFCLEQIRDFFEQTSGSYFLTVGDGYCGREASFIKKFGNKVHASDIETCLIKIAHEKKLIDEFSEQNMLSLSFPDNYFDYSLVKESLHHLSKPYQGLYELFRVSKKGVILIEPNGDSDKNYNSRGFELCGNYSFAFKSDELIKVGLSYGYNNFAYSYSNMFYGQHNIENIKSGNAKLEMQRLIKLDENTISIHKPLLIFIFLNNNDVLDKLKMTTVIKH